MIDWSGPVIHVVGLGIATDVYSLSTEARKALERAEVIIGDQRQLGIIGTQSAKCIDYPSPINKLKQLLEKQQGKRLTILASGDPLFFGIGHWLNRNIPEDKLQFHPNISAVQAAFARIKQPWQDAEVVTLHGRPLAGLLGRLQSNRQYALLTDAKSHPQAIAKLVDKAGYKKASFQVAEALGTDQEQTHPFTLAELLTSEQSFNPLNIVILETGGKRGYLPEFPGIPDQDFITDGEPGKGMISKREVRLSILSLLQPAAGETGWDVGAGCGAVSVEWARWNPRGQVYAVECITDRLECLIDNREKFGVVTSLCPIEGTAPDALANLPDPDAIFVGGSSGNLPEILKLCWQRLLPGGRLVASAVTETTRTQLQQFADGKNAEWTQLAISRPGKLGDQLLFRPQLPVLLMRLQKRFG